MRLILYFGFASLPGNGAVGISREEYGALRSATIPELQHHSQSQPRVGNTLSLKSYRTRDSISFRGPSPMIELILVREVSLNRVDIYFGPDLKDTTRETWAKITYIDRGINIEYRNLVPVLSYVREHKSSRGMDQLD